MFRAMVLCSLLLLAACTGAIKETMNTGDKGRALLQLYTEDDLQQEVELVKQHIANLQQQLLADNGMAPNDGATDVTTYDHGSSLSGHAGNQTAEGNIFTFDLSLDQQAPPVDMSQREAGLFRALSRIVETEPQFFDKAMPHSGGDSSSSSGSSGEDEGYHLESAQMLGPGYLLMRRDHSSSDPESADPVEAQLNALLTKLIGRGPRLGVKESQFVPRAESGILAPFVDISMTEQSGRSGNYQADTPLGNLPDYDPSTANEKLKSLLSRVTGISGSIVKAAARKEFIPRSEASKISADGGMAGTASTYGPVPADEDIHGVVPSSTESSGEFPDTTASGKGHHYGSTLALPPTGDVALADTAEIHADSSLHVKILNPVTLAAPPAGEAMSFQDIQQTAADIAAAAPASKHSSSNHAGTDVNDDQTAVLMAVSSAVDTEDRALRDDAAAPAPSKRGLTAGAVTGIAVGAFVAVITGTGVLLMCQARHIQKEIDSGYTKTAQNEDVESASKPPAICVSPAVSMGGAFPSSGGAKASVGGAFPLAGDTKASVGGACPVEGGAKASTGSTQNCSTQELSAKAVASSRVVVLDPFTPVNSGTGYLRAQFSTRIPVTASIASASSPCTTAGSISSCSVFSLD